MTALWNEWLKGTLIAALSTSTGLGGCLGTTGCVSGTSELERFSEHVLTSVVEPTVEKLAEELAAQAGSLSGGVQGINPGYKIKFIGILGSVVLGEVALNLDGVAGQLSGSALMGPPEEG